MKTRTIITCFALLLFVGCPSDCSNQTYQSYIQPDDQPPPVLTIPVDMNSRPRDLTALYGRRLELPGCNYDGNNRLFYGSEHPELGGEPRLVGLHQGFQEASELDGLVGGHVVYVYSGIQGENATRLEAPIIGRVSSFINEDESFTTQPECSFLYRIEPASVSLDFVIAGAGQLIFPADARNTEDLTCSPRGVGCTRKAPISGELSFLLRAADGGLTPEFDVERSSGCELVGSLERRSDSNTYEGRVRTGSGRGSCFFVFPQPERTVDVGIQVQGQTVVTYGVMPDGQRGSCGDGMAPASCFAAVPDGAEISFAATRVDSHEPIWSGACEEAAADPWEARIASVGAGDACRLELMPDGSVDCGSVTAPRLQIALNGEPLPVSEVFVDIPAPDPARADLSAEVVVEEPASYLWEESVDGSFVELGRSESLNNQPLSCPRGGNYCQLRLTINDACGRRRGDLFYRLID